LNPSRSTLTPDLKPVFCSIATHAPESKESNAQASTTNSIPSVSSAKDADMVKQQIKDLSQRVDQLRARVDGVTRPTDETPPSMRTMQIKMSELAREMVDIATLPAAYRQYDNRLETLKEELKTLRARIEAAQADPIGGRTPSLTPLAGSAAPASSPTARNDPRGGP
jgi:predicted RNase H-like nuclease (RuvC/YqgF family)